MIPSTSPDNPDAADEGVESSVDASEARVPSVTRGTPGRGGRTKLRRRVAATMALVLGLVSVGFAFTVLTPSPQVAVAQGDPALVRQGEQLYDNACITCHGANLQGVEDRGTSLIGVGSAAVFFQVSSGRMPAVANVVQAERKPPRFDLAEVDALSAYVETYGGGPDVPRDPDGSIAAESLRGDDVARGGELFRLNCASCHNFTGRGGALSGGKYAPSLDPATEAQIYTAMTSGPQNMPKFSDRQLSVEEKQDIIAYVKSSSEASQPGGYGLGGFGPVSEGLFIWIVGIVGLVGATLWIGARA